jgi:hypothetical protein
MRSGTSRSDCGQTVRHGTRGNRTRRRPLGRHRQRENNDPGSSLERASAHVLPRLLQRLSPPSPPPHHLAPQQQPRRRPASPLRSPTPWRDFLLLLRSRRSTARLHRCTRCSPKTPRARSGSWRQPSRSPVDSWWTCVASSLARARRTTRFVRRTIRFVREFAAVRHRHRRNLQSTLHTFGKAGETRRRVASANMSTRTGSASIGRNRCAVGPRRISCHSTRCRCCQGTFLLLLLLLPPPLLLLLLLLVVLSTSIG